MVSSKIIIVAQNTKTPIHQRCVHLYRKKWHCSKVHLYLKVALSSKVSHVTRFGLPLNILCWANYELLWNLQVGI